MRINKVSIGVSLAIAALIIGGGIAVAAWTTSGTGSGAGAATVAQSLVVTPVTPAGAGASMYPGGPAGPVFFTIQNPNPFAVTITSVSYGTPTSTDTSTCPSSNVSLDGMAPTTVSISLAAGATDTNQEIAGVLDLAHAALNGCQGVAFDIPLTVTGTQQ